MTNAKQYYRTKADIARGCKVARPTVYKWLTHPDFPAKQKDGWPCDQVERFAREAMKRAIKAQTGDNADLKRKKLELQCDILSTQLAQRSNDLAADQSQTVSRAELIKALQDIGYTTYGAMRSVREMMVQRHNLSGTDADDCKTYGAISGFLDEIRQACRKTVLHNLKDCELGFSEQEIDEIRIGWEGIF